MMEDLSGGFEEVVMAFFSDENDKLSRSIRQTKRMHQAAKKTQWLQKPHNQLMQPKHHFGYPN